MVFKVRMEAGIHVQAQLTAYFQKGVGVGYVYERVACDVCGQNVGYSGKCNHCGNNIIVKIEKVKNG